MKRFLISAILCVVVFTFASAAFAYIRDDLKDFMEPEETPLCVTKRGYVASTTEDLLNQALKLAITEDKSVFHNFIRE